MEPKVAFTTAPTAKLLCAEMLWENAKNNKHKHETLYIAPGLQKMFKHPVGVVGISSLYFFPLLHFHSFAGQSKNTNTLPGYSHANIVGQRNDGGDGCGKLSLRAEVIVFMVSIADNQSNQYQGQQVCRENKLKENK